MSRLIPRGVVVAGLGRRLLAALIDALPMAFVSGAVVAVLNTTSSPAIALVATIGAAVVAAGYALYQWWAYGTRGAGIGARFTGLRVVSLADGKPVGWWRFFLRQLVFSTLMATVVGGIALLIFLVIHERRQGWHDMVAGAVVVQPKTAEARQEVPQRRTPAASTVGLPPHLASTFSPQPGTSSSWAPEAQPAPDWLPGVASEPLPAQRPLQPQAGQAPWSPQQGAPAAPPWQPPAKPLSAQPQQGSQPWAPAAQQPPAAQGPQWPEADTPVAPVRSPSGPSQKWIPIPSASSVIEPSRKVRVRPRDFGEVEDDEGTRITSLPSTATGRDGAEGWYVRLDDGREVDLTVTVLLGRNPHKGADDRDEVQLVPASGDGRMISRTHVLIGTDPRGVFVVDRGSTNGTALVATGGSLEPCPPGTQVRVREGQQVSYGNRWFTLLRRPAPFEL